MRVGIDLDGVLYNFHQSVVTYMRSAQLDRAYNMKQSFNSWNFFEDWGMTDHEFVNVCNNGVDAGIIFSGPARKRAGSAIRRIKRAGHEVHIVTDRAFGKTPKASQDATIFWLRMHNIPYDTITFSADKTVVPTDMFVEDKIENYRALEAAGTKAYLISRPWNKSFVADNRISGITEFANIVIGASIEIK